MEFKYTPDEDVRVHGDGAIRLISKLFQSHENGLPEWLKNASDAYVNDEIEEPKRTIIVFFSWLRGKTPSISCLDFCGMTSEIIENYFRVWADPEASSRNSSKVLIQGGHGNGGKSYMTQMFNQHAQLHTIREGKGCLYGVRAGTFHFGYIPDRKTGRDFSTTDIKKELERALSPLGCTISSLPAEVQRVAAYAKGFTLVTGYSPKGYTKRIPAHDLIQKLEQHPQMIQTLELCRIFALVNGQQYNEGKPLSLPIIPPMPGAEKPRIIDIPENLTVPGSGEEISTTENGSLENGKLILKTSDKHMRYRKKERHNIIFRAKSGYIGYIPVLEFDIQSPFRDQIYGECCLDSLEPYKPNDRSRPIESPLTNAISDFIAEQIQAYAKEFEAQDRRKYSQDEKEALSEMNEALDSWKNQYLSEVLQGLWGPGTDGPPPSPPPLPSGIPAKMELSMSSSKAGLGVTFRPILKFYDSEGRKIRPVPYRWVSEDTNVAMVDEDLAVINTFSFGETEIFAETLDGKFTSDKLPLSVVHIHKIRILPEKVELAIGGRSKLTAICQLEDGSEESDIYLIWTEGDTNITRVSAFGMVYGYSPGNTEVVAGDDHCSSETSAKIEVIQGKGSGKGNKEGRGFPSILLSDYDDDPETGEPVSFSKDYPPVHQRAEDVDRNIWWINTAAPLATLYLDRNRGYGYESREWRMYHLERYIDAMVQISLVNTPIETQELSINDWIQEWGMKSVEIQTVAEDSLADFIETGKKPTDLQ